MIKLQPGKPWPLGAEVDGQGINLAVWAPDATQVDWCVFDDTGTQELGRHTLPTCTDGVWHGWMPGAGPGLVYGLRVHGPWSPAQGHRFNPAKVLLDPYAREVVGRYEGDLTMYRGDDPHDPSQRADGDNAAVALKARVLAPAELDRRAPRPARPAVPWSQTVLYEVHVKGATQLHPGVPASQRGRYAGLAHPLFLAHLRRLGITTLSLLPVHARADEARLQGLGLSNYWGYSSIGFFAPEPRYWTGRPGTSPTSEFRAMVDGLHAAGFEVMLDVVFNHTAETDQAGPTLSFRGLANARYYRLEPHDRSRYVNWAGCGNVLDLSEPRVVQLVIESLRHWVEVMGVDGFRFDLAPILGRGDDGNFSRAAGFFAALRADPVLARAKLVAEPWDIGPGGYQLGAFPPGWAEWNDRYRDAMRAFWLRGGGDRGEFAHRWAASSNEFHHGGRAPAASVNFLTAHDGFTLRDLLSFDHKHNEANGEHNRDGYHHNASWNCGVEGTTNDPAVKALRQRLARALLATLLLSQGTPMLLAGDELGHSQQGNNNAYCQDNATTWLDWASADADLQATVAALLRLRREQPALRLPYWLNGGGDVQWLEPDGQPIDGPAWQDTTRRALMIRLQDPGAAGAAPALLLINAAAQSQRFVLPDGPWRPVFDSDAPAGACAASTWPRSITVPGHGLRLALGVLTESR